MRVLATIRPATAAGDQEDTTSVDASATNGTGISEIVELQTAAQSFVSTELGVRAVTGLRAWVKIAAVLAGGATLSELQLHLADGAGGFDLPIENVTTWQNLGTLRVDSDGNPWTGTRIDAVTAKATGSASLPVAASATLKLVEVFLEALDAGRLVQERLVA